MAGAACYNLTCLLSILLASACCGNGWLLPTAFTAWQLPAAATACDADQSVYCCCCYCCPNIYCCGSCCSRHLSLVLWGWGKLPLLAAGAAVASSVASLLLPMPCADVIPARRLAFLASTLPSSPTPAHLPFSPTQLACPRCLPVFPVACLACLHTSLVENPCPHVCTYVMVANVLLLLMLYSVLL